LFLWVGGGLGAVVECPIEVPSCTYNNNFKKCIIIRTFNL